jgi:hypothetical protein
VSIDWIIKLGASNIDIIILIMGLGWATYSFNAHRETKKRLDKLSYSLGQTDKLAYGIGIAIQKEGNIKLFKQSANGAGDHALNRDV